MIGETIEYLMWTPVLQDTVWHRPFLFQTCFSGGLIVQYLLVIIKPVIAHCLSCTVRVETSFRPPQDKLISNPDAKALIYKIYLFTMSLCNICCIRLVSVSHYT